MSDTAAATHVPRLARVKNKLVGEWLRIGEQTRFYFMTLAAIPDAAIRHRTEVLRLIAQMGLGTGALAAIATAPLTPAELLPAAAAQPAT